MSCCIGSSVFQFPIIHKDTKSFLCACVWVSQTKVWQDLVSALSCSFLPEAYPWARRMTDYSRNKGSASVIFQIITFQLRINSLCPACILHLRLGKSEPHYPWKQALPQPFWILFLSLKSLPAPSTELCLLASFLILHTESFCNSFQMDFWGFLQYFQYQVIH